MTSDARPTAPSHSRGDDGHQGTRRVSGGSGFWIAVVVLGLLFFLSHLYISRDIRARFPFMIGSALRIPRYLLTLLGAVTAIALLAVALVRRQLPSLRAAAGVLIGTALQTGLLVTGDWDWVPSWYDDEPGAGAPRLAWAAGAVLVAGALLIPQWRARSRKPGASTAARE